MIQLGVFVDLNRRDVVEVFIMTQPTIPSFESQQCVDHKN